MRRRYIKIDGMSEEITCTTQEALRQEMGIVSSTSTEKPSTERQLVITYPE